MTKQKSTSKYFA